MIYVAILGAGVVGSGVYEALCRNASHIAARSMSEVEVKYVLDIRELPDAPFADKLTDSFDMILRDPDVDIVVETIGGSGAAYEFTKSALQAGKSVITSNKELVAEHGVELLSIATEKGVNYMFEAAVGGGAPIIRPLIQCLSANIVQEIYGILNGTTNFILSRMIDDGMSLNEALKQAQLLGYAEQNPAADVEGIDPQRKISILASLAGGKYIPPSHIAREGIMGMTLDDVRYAAGVGCVIKLLGRYRLLDDGRAAAYVAPHLIPKSNIIAGVSDVFNGIVVRGNLVGEVAFYGQGAGKIPTASAVAADVIDAARHIGKTKNKLLWTDCGTEFIANATEIPDRRYIRASGALSEAKRIFGKLQVISGEDGGEALFITQKVSGEAWQRGLDEFKTCATVYAAYRVLGGEVSS